MKYKIIWGLALDGDAASLPKGFEEYLIKQGHAVCSANRTSFETIKQFLSTCKREEGTTLILPFFRVDGNVQQSVTLEELEAYRKIVPDINIIVVIPDSEFGKDSLFRLLKNGYYNGIAAGDTDTLESLYRILGKVVTTQRSYADARAYYRITETVEGRADASTMFSDAESAYAFMLRPLATGESYSERLGILKERVEDISILWEVIKRLDEGVKNEIRSDEIFYSTFEADFDAAERTGDKKKSRAEKKTEEPEIRSITHTSSIRGAVRKVPIGVASVTEKLGSTHQSILVAKFLIDHGYEKVAVIEDSRQKHKSFEVMAENFGYENIGGHFQAEGIDFYCDFDVDAINSLNSKCYDFYVFDFGLLTEENNEDFNSCTTQLLLCGSQAWNFNDIERLKDIVPYDDQLNMYDYCFMSAPKKDSGNIRRKMSGVKKVRFSKYYPEPFSSVDDDDMLYLILKGFIGNDVEKKESFTKRIKRFFD